MLSNNLETMPAGIVITNGYKFWSYQEMKWILELAIKDPKSEYNRTYLGMIIEWYLHNFGYYITLPFKFIPAIKKINYRCKDVNLETHKNINK